MALIPALEDNYIVVLHDDRQAAVVDPAEAQPVQSWLEGHGLELVAVLQTHHHGDHIGGTPQLLRRWPEASVVAAAADRERIPFQTHGVADGACFSLLGRSVAVLGVPGHTRAHLAYHLPALAPPCSPGAESHAAETPRWDGKAFRFPAAPGWGELFCGDTLFLAGCGRLFEGTPPQMHASLQRLAALPSHTRVWCAHEYTLTNLRWALVQRPEDPALRRRLEEVSRRRREGLPTLPGSLVEEQATNLFLRAGSAAELAELRASRNGWTG
ncbi:MAG: hydroxyacylglutathione hydrolase C-terminal domain-containing protein [Synechococcaceae cyanobacterium]|nr:hydroxyacylglutathione hydrolase C-terminal domain-containing protein [Synechococcaceae cyanobacterium]